MKKIISLALAASMIASMGVTAFATVHGDGIVGIDDSMLYLYNADNGYYEPTGDATGASLQEIKYGDKVAFKIAGSGAADKSTVTKYRAYADWKHGNDLADAPTIQYVKHEATPAKFWMDKTNNATMEFTLTSADGVTFTPDGGSSVLATKVTLLGTFFDGVQVNGVTINSAANATTDEDALIAALKVLVNALTDADATASLSTTHFAITNGSTTPHTNDAISPAELIKLKTALNNKVETLIDEIKATYTYDYYAVVPLKASTTTSIKDIGGNIKVAKTSSAAKNQVGATLSLAIGQGDAADAGYGVYEVQSNAVSYTDDLGNGDRPVLDFKTKNIQDIVDIDFKDEVLYSVDVTGMNKVNVKYSTSFNSTLAAEYPKANLNFYSWTAEPIFNRTGDLFIYADKDSYVYEIVDGNIKEVKSTFDEDYEAHKIRTRKLGKYVVSDIELVEEEEVEEPTTPDVEEPATPPTTTPTTPSKPNPPTGR